MREIKVAVLMRTEEDADHVRKVLSELEGVTFCDSPTEADAVICDNEILSEEEKDALIALAEHGTIKEAARKTFRKESTLRKHLLSVRKKLKVQTKIQALVFAYRLGLINLQDLFPENQ